MYAAAGIPEYWVFDVTGRRFVRMHKPTPEGFEDRYGGMFGMPLASATMKDFVIDTVTLMRVFD